MGRLRSLGAIFLSPGNGEDLGKVSHIGHEFLEAGI
jgi:hypothetical protein